MGDENKIGLDGKLTHYTYEVRKEPVVKDFSLWWTRAAPDIICTVAVEFYFNGTIRREDEDPSTKLLVIEVKAPEGMSMAVRRPRDVKSLDPSSTLQITAWNWTDVYPRQLWFGVNPTADISGHFHYAFPVLTPPATVGMPFSNLWEIKFCVDSPFCETLILNVPIPGFNFGEEPEALSDTA